MISSLINRLGRCAEQPSMLHELADSLRADGPLTLGVASCGGDGSARVVDNLVRTAAKVSDAHVLCVQLQPLAGAELRNANPHPGWRDFVAGEAELDDVLEADGESGVWKMTPGGRLRAKPSARSLSAALEVLQQRFDLIVFDLASAPGWGSRDLAAKLDGVVLALEEGRTSREAAHRAKRDLEQAGARVVGVVFDRRSTPRSSLAPADRGAVSRKGRRRAAWLSMFRLWRQPASKQKLAEPGEFGAAIELERMRADRTGLSFSLLVHTSGAGELVGRTLTRFTDVVLGRIRATDTAGWLDGHRPAILLPDTDEAGAAKLATDLTELLEEAGIAAAWKVRTYHPHPPRNERPPQDGEMISQADSPASSNEAARRPAAGALSLDAEAMFAQPLPRWKRGLDVCGALLGLALGWPLLAVCIVAVRLTSRGPAIFTHQRSGLGGRPFAMYKIRTMHVDAEKRKAALRPLSEQDGPAFKLKHDPRVTGVGRILRQTSLDELPQLWNVLVGDMTLVGPRPLPVEESAECASWHRRRLLVTPGLTCIWQVRGRSQVAFDEWMRMDLRYARRRSIFFDLKLILQTIPAVILRRGAQ